MRNRTTQVLVIFITILVMVANPTVAFVVINGHKSLSTIQPKSITTPSVATYFGKSSIDVTFRPNNKYNLFQQRNRYSRGRIQLSGGLFGLGLPELLLIAVGIGVVLGPEGIAKTVKSATTRTVEIAEEMKSIPEEFQKGVELGEIEARSRKAKRIVVTKGSSSDQDTANE